MSESLYPRPSLPTLINQIRTDLNARLAQDDILRRQDSEVYARVIGAATDILGGYLDFIFDQILEDRSCPEVLLRQAARRGLTLKDGAAATGSATTASIAGVVVPDDTLYQADDGREYLTVGSVNTTAPTTTLLLQAVDAGADGNLLPGQTLQMVTPLPGVSSSASVVTMTGGGDPEDIESLRQRLLYRLQQPPRGGTLADYKAWAESYDGVKTAWPSRFEFGVGTIGLRFITTAANPIPSAAMVAAVQAFIDSLAPARANVTVLAPSTQAVPLTLSISPDSLAIRAAVASEFAAFLLRESSPGGVIRLSRLDEAISLVTGETYHKILSPSADVQLAAGAIAVAGAVTWI